MADDLIDEIRADWRAQDVEIQKIRLHLRRWRPLAYSIIGAEIIGAGVALAMGIVFAFMAWNSHDLFFALSAMMLLVVCVPLFVPHFLARRRSLDWPDQTLEGTLHYALSRTRAMDTVLGIQFWSGVALLGFVVLVWICDWAGLFSGGYPLMAISAAWLVGGFTAILWAKWRGRRNARERLQCEKLLASFRSANVESV